MTKQFPDAFKRRLQLQLGDAFQEFESSHTVEPPVSIRKNPLKPTPGQAEHKQIPWTDFGYYLKQRPSFTLDPFFHAGCYYVQEASSMFIEQVFRQLDVRGSRLRVLDLCAAPGGKSTHLLSLLPEDALLVSNEVIRSRVNVLSENVQKWGYPNAVVTNNDPEHFTALEGFFDVILVDAPCSGEGLFRKDVRAIEEWSEENVLLCAQRQRRIVQDVWPALKENGLLIYSTCTYNEAEDEGTLQWIRENLGCSFASLDINGWSIDGSTRTGVTGYHFYPHRVQGEGFFLSVMRKEQPENEIRIRPGKKTFASPEKRNVEIIRNWIARDDMKFIQRDDIIQTLPSEHAETILFLTQHLRVAYAGTFLATAKQNKLVPEHAAALSVMLLKDAFPHVVLTAQEALQYLRKDALNIANDTRGFALATYENIPLGWMNVLPGRINNLYPSEWRIRMSV